MGTSLLTLLLLLAGALVACRADVERKTFTDTWAVRVRRDVTESEAKRMAKRYGFNHVRQVGYLDDTYHWDHLKSPARSHRAADNVNEHLLREPKIVWARQQHLIWRKKRSAVLAGKKSPGLSDPLWDKEWHLNENAHRKLNSALKSSFAATLGVEDVWRRGYTGRGATVMIVDDGVEHAHPDLAENYESDISLDLDSEDYDPAPRYTKDNENGHGTSCAGIVAAVRNNSVCTAGVAPSAAFGAIRVLDGPEMDILEASALLHSIHDVDIYSCSWGPEDNGKDLDGPGPLTVEALLLGVTKGRSGLGNLYVFASGNGGYQGDSCAYDGYASSRFTLSISAVSQIGRVPWYAEPCPAVLASAFSSGNWEHEASIATTKLHGECTEDFSGTSAAAPMAAGVFALLLEARPDLTVRDVQHIVALTSHSETLEHSLTTDWKTNAAGFGFSPYFGFGLLNASAMVSTSQNWSAVPPLDGCVLLPVLGALPFHADKPLHLDLPAAQCVAESGLQLEYLEQVTVIISMDVSRRSSAILDVISPQGTRVRILYPRPLDKQHRGLHRWPISTSFFWGERPTGIWKIEVTSASAEDSGYLLGVELVLSGTTSLPASYPHPRPRDPSQHDDVTILNTNMTASAVETDKTYLRFAEETEYVGDRYGGSSSYEGAGGAANALKSVHSLNTAGKTETETTSENMDTTWCNFTAPAATDSGGLPGACIVKSSDGDLCGELGLRRLSSGSGAHVLCSRACPDGAFAVPGSRDCQPCRLSCSACRSLTNCTACRAGYVLHSNTCVARCPAGFYHARTTEPLNSRSESSDSGAAQSSQFAQSMGERTEHRYAMVAGESPRIPAGGGDGQFLAAAGDCLSCPSNCVLCRPTHGITACLRCRQGTFLLKPGGDSSAADCVQACPENYSQSVSRSGRGICKMRKAK